jgi:hypothetical protein
MMAKSTQFHSCPFAMMLSGLFLVAAPCLAQGRVDEFLAVKNWHGTVTITGSGSGSTSGGIYSDVWRYSIASLAIIELPTFQANIQGWTGTMSGSSVVNAVDTATFGGCVETLTQALQGRLGAPITFTMHLQGANEYAFYPSVYSVNGATSLVSNTCAPGTTGGTGPAAWSPVLSSQVHELPAAGFILKGSETLTMNSPEQPLSLIFGGSAAVINVTVSWDIEGGVDPAQVGIAKTVTRDLATSEIVIVVEITNTGGLPAENTELTIGKLNATTGAILPQLLGTIDPGETATATLRFPATVGPPGAIAVLTIGGTYTGSSFSSASKITLP